MSKRCEVCGFRRRGPNHDRGPHHLSSAYGLTLVREYDGPSDRAKVVAENAKRRENDEPFVALKA